jgi:phospholipid/cholesterol/gamma-HCH transport system substrate-binding protein
MRSSRAVEISTGSFVLLGFAALFFLVTQITNREFSVGGNSYDLEAQFENIGSLKVGAAVSMAGVTVGRVDSIVFDQDIYKAVVRMKISSEFDRLPKDSDASIMTAGLLGGQYVGITAGGDPEYLKNGDRIEFVQDALVLENLINQLVASFGGNKEEGNKEEGKEETPSKDDQSDQSGKTTEAGK